MMIQIPNKKFPINNENQTIRYENQTDQFGKDFFDSGKQVRKIAYELGFESPQHFSLSCD